MKHMNLFKGKFGIEKEAVRVDINGVVSRKNHPRVFQESNPFITKDFAESQIEMITPPCDSIDRAIDFLEDIQNVVYKNIGDELLWGSSNPPILVENIDVARFEKERSKEQYREYLADKYGSEKSIISGVHFNFSFDETLLRSLYKEEKSNKSYVEYKDEIYLKVTKTILKDRWFLIYLTSASPVFHESFYDKCVISSKRLNNGDCMIEGMKSLRNSRCGYRNKDNLMLDYSSIKTYEESIEKEISLGSIAGESELYTSVRLKKTNSENVDYIELRFLDVNPFTLSGVSDIDLKYIHMFLVYALFQKDFSFDVHEQKLANKLHDVVSNSDEKEIEGLKEQMIEIHKGVVSFYENYDTPYEKEKIFVSVQERIDSIESTYSYQLKERYKDSSYIEYHLGRAKFIKSEMLGKPFVFKSYPTLELSTKILLQTAIQEGILFEVWDEESNFVKLVDPMSKQVQYVQQATKTNLDKYANVLAMENKLLTKRFLVDAGIVVPSGYVIHKGDETDIDFGDKGVVVKPNSTNFGVGITIYPDGATKREIDEAIKYAFTKDDTVLVEPFIKGKEYRFLIIGDEVVGVLHRKAANVIGDGIHTIEELVEEKNQHVYRGSGYVTPLEYIQIGPIEEEFLSKQGLDKLSVPKKCATIYLRENSNISTGGDSIDYTDEIHESYKDIALLSAKAMGVSITGVDMMIEDITQIANINNYGILELNFNPAIHIHTYPLVGKNRYPSEKILKLLFNK